MSKPKFDVNATAKKFLSGVTGEDTQQPEQKKAAAATGAERENPTAEKKAFIPESREIGTKRPKSIDKETGEVTKQIGYFVTERQDRELKRLAFEMNTNKSALIREAIRMYFDYLERESIK